MGRLACMKRLERWRSAANGVVAVFLVAAPIAASEGGAVEESCSSSEFGDRLFEFVRAAGGKVQDIEVRQFSPHERGIFASRALPPDTEILNVPLHLIVTPGKAAQLPLGEALLASTSKQSGWEHQVTDLSGLLLATWLMHHIQEPAAAFKDPALWETYLQSLPKQFPTVGLNYSEEVLRKCAAGLPTEAYLVRGKAAMQREFRWLQGLSSTDSEELTLEGFIYARLVTFSRTFTVSNVRLATDETMFGGLRLWSEGERILQAASRGKDEAHVFVPVADMLNHAFGSAANCRWRYVGGGSGFSISTKRGVAAGEELLLTYGDKENRILLSHYGFTMDGNPHEKLDLDLSLGDSGVREPISLTISAFQPASVDVISGVFDAYRAAVDATAKSEVQRELSALRLLMDALESEGRRIRPPADCPGICVAWRLNLLALLDTWLDFVKVAIQLLQNGTVEWQEVAMKGDEGSAYQLHSRLYFGIWFRNTGRGLASEAGISLDELAQARHFGSVSYVDTMPDMDFA